MNKKILCGAIALSMMFAVTGCNKAKSDPVIATVGEYSIKLSEYEFYLNNLKQQMQGTELSSDEDWETMDINGKKAIDVVKEKALETAKTNISYILLYEKLGNEFTDEVNQAIETTKNSVVSQYDQNGGYNEFLKEANVTDDFINLLCKSMYCSEQLYTQFTEGIEITDAEAKEFYDEYKNEYYSGYRRAKHVLILTKDMETNEAYSEDKKAESKTKADDIYKRALAGENFDTLVSEYSEDPGSKSNPDGYVFTDGEMVQQFQDCVDSLEIGGIGFCESDFGYHIIQKLEVTEQSFINDIKGRILSNRFIDYIEGKNSDFGITLVETDEMAKIMTKAPANDADTTEEATEE